MTHPLHLYRYSVEVSAEDEGQADVVMGNRINYEEDLSKEGVSEYAIEFRRDVRQLPSLDDMTPREIMCLIARCAGRLWHVLDIDERQAADAMATLTEAADELLRLPEAGRP